jgi:hypothetical protein
MTEITRSQAEAVATMLRLDAFTEATAAKVRRVALGGSLDDDPALESAILQALEEAGLPLNG